MLADLNGDCGAGAGEATDGEELLDGHGCTNEMSDLFTGCYAIMYTLVELQFEDGVSIKVRFDGALTFED